jgi:hypothetical protein
MFRKLLQTSPAESRYAGLEEERNGTSSGSPTPDTSERNGNNPSENAKLSSFEDIYHQSAFKSCTSTAEWDILKVADMIASNHLHGLSSAGKHSALMMALEAADVAVEDMLQDAVQRQRVLNKYEDAQRRRLEQFEKATLSGNAKLADELEGLCVQYRMRIANGVQELERQRAMFHDWQERKEREQRRISEAASACVHGESGSDASLSRLLEKNSGRLRELA